MKHSIKEKTPRTQKGYSKGKNKDFVRQGPITIEECLSEAVPFAKQDATIREIMIRTDPSNDSSPIIKMRFKPLDNPKTLLELLQGILIIKKGVIGNNVTTGPLQHAYWRSCLEGAAEAKFNEYATALGTETAAHLVQVEQRLVTHFAPREVLSQQLNYFRYRMRKPHDYTTRQYVGAVNALNMKFEELPPAFDAAQKIPETELLDILASKAKRSHKELLTDHGFDPHTEDIDKFVEICERAETKEALSKKSDRSRRFESDDDSDQSVGYKKKPKKRPHRPATGHSNYYCSYHGNNNTHDSKNCKVLLAEKEGKPDWKKKSKDGKGYKDYKSKYAKKTKELNILQSETKLMKKKWIKAHKALKEREKKKNSQEGETSEGDSSEEVKIKKETTFVPREHQRDASESESSDASDCSTSSEDSSE
jgi:hypothetical protein